MELDIRLGSEKHGSELAMWGADCLEVHANGRHVTVGVVVLSGPGETSLL